MTQDYLEIIRRSRAASPASAAQAVPQVFLRAFRDGCKAHGETHDGVAERWARVRVEQAASMCGCCCGPCRVGSEVCTRCADADLAELRTAPRCVVCAQTGYTPTDAGWLCEACHTAGAEAYRA